MPSSSAKAVTSSHAPERRTPAPGTISGRWALTSRVAAACTASGEGAGRSAGAVLKRVSIVTSAAATSSSCTS